MATPTRNGHRTVAEPRPMAVRPIQVEVTSATDPDLTYLVTLPHCPCKDFRYRRDGRNWCKHLDAAQASVGGWQDAQAAELARRIQAAIHLAGNDTALVAVLMGND